MRYQKTLVIRAFCVLVKTRFNFWDKERKELWLIRSLMLWVSTLAQWFKAALHVTPEIEVPIKLAISCQVLPCSAPYALVIAMSPTPHHKLLLGDSGEINLSSLTKRGRESGKNWSAMWDPPTLSLSTGTQHCHKEDWSWCDSQYWCRLKHFTRVLSFLLLDLTVAP